MTQGRPDRGKGYRLALLPALALVALSACGGEKTPTQVMEEQEKDEGLAPLSCGLDGNDVHTDKCWIEWLPGAAGEARDFLIHQADGGFRRFTLSADGNRVDVADGAEAFLLTQPVSDTVNFKVGTTSYNVPLTALKPR